MWNNLGGCSVPCWTNDFWKVSELLASAALRSPWDLFWAPKSVIHGFTILLLVHLFTIISGDNVGIHVQVIFGFASDRTN